MAPVRLRTLGLPLLVTELRHRSQRPLQVTWAERRSPAGSQDPHTHQGIWRHGKALGSHSNTQHPAQWPESPRCCLCGPDAALSPPLPPGLAPAGTPACALCPPLYVQHSPLHQGRWTVFPRPEEGHEETITIQHREGRQVAQGHTAQQRQNPDANPVSAQKPKLVTPGYTDVPFPHFIFLK